MRSAAPVASLGPSRPVRSCTARCAGCFSGSSDAAPESSPASSTPSTRSRGRTVTRHRPTRCQRMNCARSCVRAKPISHRYAPCARRPPHNARRPMARWAAWVDCWSISTDIAAASCPPRANCRAQGAIRSSWHWLGSGVRSKSNPACIRAPCRCYRTTWQS